MNLKENKLGYMENIGCLNRRGNDINITQKIIIKYL